MDPSLGRESAALSAVLFGRDDSGGGGDSNGPRTFQRNAIREKQSFRKKQKRQLVWGGLWDTFLALASILVAAYLPDVG